MDGKQRLDIDSIHLDDHSDAATTPPVSPARDRRKNRKKKNRNNKSCYYKNSSSSSGNPGGIPAASQKPAEEEEEEEEEESPRQLQTASAFHARADPRPIPLRASKAFEYEDAHALDSSPSSPYPLSSSCPLFSLRSALRGGHEGLGLGPRPKLHVKWAVDVHDPPKSSVSHTLNRVSHGSSRKKRSKSKTKNKNLKPLISVENQEVVACAPDSPVSEDETVPEKPAGAAAADDDDELISSPGSFTAPVDKLHPLPPAKSFFASMEVAMQHMILASSFIEQENIAGALIEYKAAANVFRLAKLDAEAERRSDRLVAAIRGQVLAYIAMATLYSASGQSSKGQKCHRLALDACCQVENLPLGHQFKGNGGSNHCSLAAAFKTAPGCEASSVCI